MGPLIVALFLAQAVDPNAEGLKALDDGKYEAAVAAFTRAVAAGPKDYSAHFNLALAYGFLHRDDEAISEYRKTLELKPGLYEAQLNAGIVLLRGKKPAEAVPLLAAASEQKPKEFRPRYYLAEAQSQGGALGDAEASYRLALEIDGTSADAELGLAQALARQGKLAEAEPHYRRAGELQPKYRDYLLQLAQFYEEARQPSPAMAIYREFPDNVAAQEHLGQLMLENKQYTDAIPRLEAAFTEDPTQANRVALAAAYVFANQPAKALPLLEQAVSDQPLNFNLRMMYGRALRDNKQYTPAATQFTEAAKLKPGEPKTWNELGVALYMAGDLRNALAAFDKALSLGENTAGNWFLRAIILDKLKQVKPALEAYQRFLSMSQNQNQDQEFQARHRIITLQRELERR